MKMKIYTLGLMFCLAGSVFAQTKKNAVIKKATTTVAIDGDLAEYTLDNTLTNHTVGETECGITTPLTPIRNNNTASFGLLWDKDFLYVGIKVVDADVKAGDNIEMFFSMLNKTVSNCPLTWPRAYVSSDFQLQLSATEPIKVETPQAGNEAAVVGSKFVKTADGYTMELKFSWTDLDYNLLESQKFDHTQGGRVIGFDILNTDVDGTAASAQLVWNNCCSNRSWIDPATFGTITKDGVASSTDVNNIVSSLTLFPNPANTEMVNVRLTAASSDKVTISVVNPLSETLYSKNVNLVSGMDNNIAVNTNGWVNGVYFVMVSNGKTNKTQKLVINK